MEDIKNHFETVVENLGSRRQKTYTKLYELCLEESRRSRPDFRLSSIGKLCETQGICSEKSLYNPASIAYRNLVSLFKAHFHFDVKAGKKTNPSNQQIIDEELNAISPAVAALIRARLSELISLKRKYQLLSSQPVEMVLIEQSTSAYDTVPTVSSEYIPSRFDLKNAHYDALKYLFSNDFNEYMIDQGWLKNTTTGRVTDANGTTIFKPLFFDALERIIGK
ncbi:gamma-mobile-trio protein GmtX [Thalassolituus oleivorans]|uniref:gamma-mobile-trio protein GmtX n=1 Tax=Thalassolituus oleivorans TaxID=187493 RepID=UPI0030C818C1